MWHHTFGDTFVLLPLINFFLENREHVAFVSYDRKMPVKFIRFKNGIEKFDVWVLKSQSLKFTERT